MKRFTKTMLTSSLGIAVLVGSLAGTHFVHAAPTKNISIIVNNETASADVTPYIKNGATLVPLTAIKNIPNVAISWDNQSKTVTVTNDNQKSTLKAGSKEAVVTGHKVSLPHAAEMKNGRIMVPIRFITSAADAYTYWNAEQQAVYIAKPSQTLIKQLQSSDLATARNAAVQLPKIDKISALSITPEMGDSLLYTTYFPKNKTDQFAEKHQDIVNYYRVSNHHAELVWSARINLNQKVKNTSLPIIPYKILESKGDMPSVPTGGVYFAYSVPGTYVYGTVDQNGKVTEISPATSEQTDQRIFNVPEEAQVN